jgi:2-haloacid dehalogenase
VRTMQKRCLLQRGRFPPHSRKRYPSRLVLLSNSDDEIVIETERTIGVKFDEIITAEQAQAYKPSHKGFLLARQRLGLEVSEIWQAGFGFKYDMVPATELGYTTVWVNRQGKVRPVDVRETFLVGDMRTLAYLVRGIAASPYWKNVYSG